MSVLYTVKRGDCLSSIAAAHGFVRWQTIYEHEQNAGLRTRRPNPNVIHPGDQIFIPDLTPRKAPRPTGGTHFFKLKRKATRLRVVLRDDEGDPLSGKSYELQVVGRTFAGVTPASGLIEHPIDARERRAVLRVWMAERDGDALPDIEWEVEVGDLDPASEVTGVQERLKNLGFDCGDVDGIVGPRTRAALRAFQHAASLPRTSKIDAATSDELRRRHEGA
jgi:N-acetylmuramoyl-L-alanine amidase